MPESTADKPHISRIEQIERIEQMEQMERMERIERIELIERIEREILPLVAPRIREAVGAANRQVLAGLEEIRLRVGLPLCLISRWGECILDRDGREVKDFTRAYRPTGDDIAKTFQILTGSSVYACEHELSRGFLSVRGGHRVGICGTPIVLSTPAGEVIRTIRDVTSLNIRIASQITGVADSLMSFLSTSGSMLSTLLISPPQMGKTTLLRDIIRQVSIGRPDLLLRGLKVGVVDERGELAACYEGIPQNDLGPRTDVLDGCSKSSGLALLIRAMSPEVVATDEIGTSGDMEAMREACRCGVTVLATAHGWSLNEVAARPTFAGILKERLFERFVLLSRRNGPGTVEAILGRDGLTRLM